MMRALFSGVSGLQSQQTGLDVIANNIANVNTTGYKQQRVSFSDLLSQTISGASGATATTGGTNPEQVGLGVSVASTDTIMTVGSSQSTGVATDLAISGDGFFVVQGGSSGEYQYTREGDLDVDENGNLTVGGYLVCGWLQYTDADGNYVYNTDAEAEPINIYSDTYNGNKKVIAAQKSTSADFSGRLDPSATVASGATALTTIGTTTSLTYDQTSSITMYDSQGNSYEATVNWKKCYVDGTATSWYWEVESSNASISPSSGYVAFDADGNMISTYTNSSSTTYTFDTTPQITVTPSTAGTAAFPVELDFTDIVSNVASGTAKVSGSADGYESGDLQDISIASDGTITGTYSNGQSQAIGQIALAVFTNPEGLAKDGNNLYVETVNSGTCSIVVAGSGGSGSLASGTLEMSNVDLAEQFSQMMISQRAYQANSKVISTADEMLQSLINMVG